MGLAGKLNSNGSRQTLPKGVDTRALNYVKAKDLLGDYSEKPIVVIGYFVTKGKYGMSPTLVTDNGIGINIPSWYLKRLNELDDTDLDNMMNGHVGISSITTRETEGGNDTYIIDFVDM